MIVRPIKICARCLFLCNISDFRVTLKTSVSDRYLFYQPMDEKIKTWTPGFPAKKTLICKRHCSISQSSCSVTVKAKDRLISRKFFEHEVFTPGDSLNQPKATRVCIRSTNQSNRSISVRLLFLFVRAFSF